MANYYEIAPQINNVHVTITIDGTTYEVTGLTDLDLGKCPVKHTLKRGISKGSQSLIFTQGESTPVTATLKGVNFDTDLIQVINSAWANKSRFMFSASSIGENDGPEYNIIIHNAIFEEEGLPYSHLTDGDSGLEHSITFSYMWDDLEQKY